MRVPLQKHSQRIGSMAQRVSVRRSARLQAPLHLLDMPEPALSCIIKEHLGVEGRLMLFKAQEAALPLLHAPGPALSMRAARVLCCRYRTAHGACC